MKTFAGRKLSRPTGARSALLRTMAAQLLRHERIHTTFAKAREVARFAERLVTLAKNKNLVTLRKLVSAVPDKELQRKIYDVLVPRYQSRPGGCTRVFRTGSRIGDGAEMAVVKLVQ